MNDPADGTTSGSKVDTKIIVMDEGTSSRKSCAPQEVWDETPIGRNLRVMSDKLQMSTMVATNVGNISRETCFHEIIPSIFSVTTIVFEQHRKEALGIGEKIQQQILGILFEQLLEYSDRFAKLFRMIELNGFDPSPLRTQMDNLITHINMYQELHNDFSGKLIESTLFTRLAAI
ncbi:hypothetical protein ACH5RR_029231 [Cinchona calisaya]|uniref:Uncharacterized protein n=1 Tax=Cinchona calisaya TaxID=153742 RepID=A0ABD2YUY5_9GENT